MVSIVNFQLNTFIDDFTSLIIKMTHTYNMQ